MLKIISALALSLFAAAPAGGSCSSLAITGTGEPGTTLTVAVAGAAPRAIALLAVAENIGQTSIPIGPLGQLDLGLAMPIVLLPLGPTDANGDVSRGIDIPNAPLPRTGLHGQAFTTVLTRSNNRPMLEFCTSNVQAFAIGS